MSQMPQPPQLSACPACDEPPQAGDRYCDQCGADLTVAAALAAEAALSAEAIADRSEAHGGLPAPPRVNGAARSTHPEPEPEPDDYELAAPTSGGYGQVADPRATAALGAPGAPGESGSHPETNASTHTSAASGTGSGTGTGADPRLPGDENRPRCAACQEGTIDEDGYCERCGHAQARTRDHMESELEGIAAASDRGLRHHRNEDAFSVSTAALPDGSPVTVAVVCDGVSSATRPDEASAAAAHAASQALRASLPRGAHPQQAMNEAIIAAADAVNSLALDTGAAAPHHEGQRHQNAPACTIVSAIVTSDILTVGWVGDSRAYWVPDDRTTPPARLTEDDSWAAQMVAAGLMSEAEAYADERAHAITGWLGADAYELEPHTASYKPDRPGVVVVCTDGLWNYAESAEQMAHAVPPDARARPLNSAQILVGHALDGGGHDNVTVAVVPFPAAPGRAGSA
ncbi:PP2C family serine/threonine-protein phosphatase [Streptomyces rapamycinicus]|uniref:Protein phosphatase n=2 Tax=Streptomyces rapamycinicus TaxID=1226757 RepID=A0A3L8RJ66_STRRN|nr:PP2C family serine/threonine-protein phosphatase [Streptomyces rapamycinicus]MBB4785470.1 serine/threonine protein phosphatase PrpC [Streptomyces rapamycinicus]RLV79063.1 protein phosphatase [Streptomyces rapamycinicus NRRL 5491]UTO65651.1 protein phosphatase 2C domain-containing protein [Streptomyces rapamycinicus]UTP33608.1 protein phosphatase 2C domain-containing protein [Streptomyces rapamycinicus NRRL 5491]